MLHRIHAVRFFALPAVARLEAQGQIGLQLLGQRLTAGRFRVEDLCAINASVKKFWCTLRSSAFSVWFTVSVRFDVRNFLLRDRAAAV